MGGTLTRLIMQYDGILIWGVILMQIICDIKILSSGYSTTYLGCYINSMVSLMWVHYPMMV